MDDSNKWSERQQHAIPAALRNLNRWLLWEYKLNPQGKPTKKPDRSTRHDQLWGFADAAEAAGSVSEHSGIGFAFTGGVDTDDGRYFALDLDGCRDPVSGALAEWALGVVQQYKGTYTEITPSGMGLRIWLLVRDYPKTFARAKVVLPYPRPDNVPSTKSVEIQIFGYGAAQFVTVTGQQLPGSGSTVLAYTNLNWLLETFDSFQTSDNMPLEDLPTGFGEPPALDQIAATLGTNHAVNDARWESLVANKAEDSSASAAYFLVAQTVLKAANGHGKAALDYLLTRTAWGAGLAEGSMDPARYGRASWVSAELRRVGGKSGIQGNVAAFDDDFDPYSWEPPEGVPPMPGSAEAINLSPILTVASPRPLFDAPPPEREYLLEHPNGDGLFPRGKVGLFSAAGGTGKTTCLVQLAIAVATGGAWFGHYNIGAKAGKRTLMLLGEEDEDEVRRKLYWTGKNMGLNSQQMRDVEELVEAKPLAGHALPLLRMGDNGNAEGTEHSEAVLQMLAQQDDWGLVIIDPVSRFTGVNVEADNVIATRYSQELERYCRAAGKPSVLAVGHTSKEARKAGKADQRGVTGLFDAVRWCATLNAVSSHRVEFDIAKNNLGPPSEGISLLRGEHGMLGAETPDESRERTLEAERAEAEKRRKSDDEVAARVTERVMRVFEFVRKNPGQTKNSIAVSLAGKKTLALDAIDKAVADGLIERRPIGRGHGYFVRDLLG